MQLALRRRRRGPSPGCGELVDTFGDHALACPRTGLLARRAKIVERAWMRVAREAVGADGQVVPQQWVCNTTVPGVAPNDRRRLDLVIYGATPMGGVAGPPSCRRKRRKLHAPAAFWASWADAVPVLRSRDAPLAESLVHALDARDAAEWSPVQNLLRLRLASPSRSGLLCPTRPHPLLLTMRTPMSLTEVGNAQPREPLTIGPLRSIVVPWALPNSRSLTHSPAPLPPGCLLFALLHLSLPSTLRYSGSCSCVACGSRSPLLPRAAAVAVRLMPWVIILLPALGLAFSGRGGARLSEPPLGYVVKLVQLLQPMFLSAT